MSRDEIPAFGLTNAVERFTVFSVYQSNKNIFQGGISWKAHTKS